MPLGYPAPLPYMAPPVSRTPGMLQAGGFLGQGVSPDLLRQARAQALIQMGIPLMGTQAAFDPGAALGQGLQAGLGAYNQYVGAGMDLQRQQEMDLLRRQQFEAQRGFQERRLGMAEREEERFLEMRTRAEAAVTEALNLLPEEDHRRKALSEMLAFAPAKAFEMAFNIISQEQQEVETSRQSSVLLELIGTLPSFKGLGPEGKAYFQEYLSIGGDPQTAFSLLLNDAQHQLRIMEYNSRTADKGKVDYKAVQSATLADVRNLATKIGEDPDTGKEIYEWFIPQFTDPFTGEQLGGIKTQEMGVAHQAYFMRHLINMHPAEAMRMSAMKATQAGDVGETPEEAEARKRERYPGRVSPVRVAPAEQRPLGGIGPGFEETKTGPPERLMKVVQAVNRWLPGGRLTEAWEAGDRTAVERFIETMEKLAPIPPEEWEWIWKHIRGEQAPSLMPRR